MNAVGHAGAACCARQLATLLAAAGFGVAATGCWVQNHEEHGMGSAMVRLVTGDIATGAVRMNVYRGVSVPYEQVVSLRIDAHPVDGAIVAYLGVMAEGDYLVEFRTTDTKTQAVCSARQSFHVDADETRSVEVSLACN